MAERETSHDIDQAAAEWAARLDRGSLSPEETCRLEAWMAGDPRRCGAFLRARAFALHSESARALGSHYNPKAFGGRADPQQTRRRFLTWGGALAASVTVAAILGLSLEAPEAYATERGEVRRMPLPDGSTLMLNTETRVRVAKSTMGCEVELVEGEIFLDGKNSRDRTLSIRVAGCRLDPKDASFCVRKIGRTPIDILVGAGRVNLTIPGGEPVVLDAGAGAVIEPPDENRVAHITLRTLSADVITREMAWLEGNIAFEGNTLAQAAAAFARYSDMRIVIEDSNLAQETITGLFAANDPGAFSRAVAALFGAQVETREDAIVLRRKVSSH
jgi:transmembrane sensor